MHAVATPGTGWLGHMPEVEQFCIFDTQVPRIHGLSASRVHVVQLGLDKANPSRECAHCMLAMSASILAADCMALTTMILALLLFIVVGIKTIWPCLLMLDVTLYSTVVF